jgi:hypothetical protein
MTDTRLAIAIADEAGIHDAPTVVTWTEIFNLIDAARAYERNQCAKTCEALWDDEAQARVNGTQEPKYHDAIECAYAIRERSNA